MAWRLYLLARSLGGKDRCSLRASRQPPTAESGVKRLGMVSSTATTPQQYLASLPEDRRKVIAGVRKLLLDNLPAGIEENMNFGMLSYEIPFSTYPDTYNKQPLMFAALAAQKHYFSLYLNSIYGFDNVRDRFEAELLATGKKLDIGKVCIRFKRLEDLPLEIVGRAISAITVKDFIANYEKVRVSRK